MLKVTALIGENVIKHSGENVLTADFAKDGTVVGLYFSSSWCNERLFTPFLADFYKQFRTRGEGKQFEVVYVSADKDEESFNAYLREMPWHAVPFVDFQRRSMLWKKYKVQSTPALVLIDGLTGKLITDNGRDCLSDDIEGKNFPWEPKSLDSILHGDLLKGDGTVDAVFITHGKVKGFYFAAHWCPPCRMFTKQLVTVYDNVNSAGHEFEVIFVSSDRSETSFKEYYREMPQTWLAVPYNDQRILRLTRHFAVQGIPTLVIVDETNKVISWNARFLIADDPDGKEFPWRRKQVEELSEGHCLSMNEEAALVYFTDGSAEHIAKAKQLLSEIASNYIEQRTSSQDSLEELSELRFYYEGDKSDEVADTIRSFAQLEGRQPTVAILDPVDQRVYALPDDLSEITRSDIESLIDKFKESVVLSNCLGSIPAGS